MGSDGSVSLLSGRSANYLEPARRDRRLEVRLRDDCALGLSKRNSDGENHYFFHIVPFWSRLFTYGSHYGEITWIFLRYCRFNAINY